jgi:hypothetical protein
MAVDVHYSALDQLRSSVKTQTGKLGAVGDKLGQSATVPASIFGKLDGADQMASSVGQIELLAAHEIGMGRSRLQGVETAVDQVETNLRKAEHASKNGLPA